MGAVIFRLIHLPQTHKALCGCLYGFVGDFDVILKFRISIIENMKNSKIVDAL